MKSPWGVCLGEGLRQGLSGHTAHPQAHRSGEQRPTLSPNSGLQRATSALWDTCIPEWVVADLGEEKDHVRETPLCPPGKLSSVAF